MTTMRFLGVVLFCVLALTGTTAEQFNVTAADPEQLARLLPGLAEQAEAAYRDPDRAKYLDNLFRLQLVAGEYPAANATIEAMQALMTGRRVPHANVLYAQYQVYANAKALQAQTNLPFADALRQSFQATYGKLSDIDALRVGNALTFPQSDAQSAWQDEVNKVKGKQSLDAGDVVGLAAAYAPYEAFSALSPLVPPLLRKDGDRRYIIADNVLIKASDGATLSAVVVRKRAVSSPQPAAFVFTIYADPPRDVQRMEYAAARGYAGVTAYTRGKASSPDAVVPYEDDGRDADGVIDWIGKQPWSNGKVGMYGGSYDGFTQWAAAKWMNPALKTIVPYVANNPGNGLPMENNIFLFVNYAWIFYVTDNKYLDEALYHDPRWRALNDKWYASGRSYRDIPNVDGTANPWLQRWLQHPSYDMYWQAMAPYKKDFARIKVPVLTITGYYDDGQASALNFLKDHYQYNAHAVHYLVIGPYDHLGSQRSRKDEILRGYRIDPAAQIDTPELTFDWLDYVMRGGKKPALLADRINYEVMGANKWNHVPSLDKMANGALTLYLTTKKSSPEYYQLSATKPAVPGFLYQQVDFADRKTVNNDYYPDPILGKKPDLSNGFTFITAPFSKPISIDGCFSGRIKAVINKRDVDLGLVLYELMPDGKLMELSYFLGRASYATDMTARTLLTPGKVETIPFDRSRLVSRRLRKGSRLLLTLNVNKNQFAQINYGSGKDVSDEDMRDATVPLTVKWLTGSYIRVPIRQ